MRSRSTSEQMMRSVLSLSRTPSRRNRGPLFVARSPLHVFHVKVGRLLRLLEYFGQFKGGLRDVADLVERYAALFELGFGLGELRAVPLSRVIAGRIIA